MQKESGRSSTAVLRRLVHERSQAFRGGAQGQLADRLSRALAELPAHVLFGDEPAQMRLERLSVARREKERRSVERLAVRRQVAQDDGGAAGGRLDRGQPESLRERGYDGGGRAGVERRERRVLDVPREQYALVEAEAADHGANVRRGGQEGVVAERAREHEPETRVANAVERLQQRLQVLVRGDSSGVDDVRRVLRQPELRGDP